MTVKERYVRPSFDLDAYQVAAMSTRREDNTHNWRQVYPARIHAELDELISQHGTALALLMPAGFDEAIDRTGIIEDQATLYYGMIEEMGDLLWFAATTATYSGYRLGDLCREALATHAEIKSFSDLDAAVMSYPGQISVVNEFGAIHKDIDPYFGRERIDDDPFYLLLRTTRRLTRSINPNSMDVAPSIYMHEPVAPLSQALADLVNVLVYIANDRLGISIAEAARQNIEKLHAKKSRIKDLGGSSDETTFVANIGPGIAAVIRNLVH